MWRAGKWEFEEANRGSQRPVVSRTSSKAYVCLMTALAQLTSLGTKGVDLF